MLPITIKPADRLIKGYYEALGQFESLHASHEGAVRKAFQDMLSGYSRKLEWTLVPEYPIHPRKGQRIIVDGVVIDFWKQRRGFWEAKDEHDDLEREIKSKIEKGYPTKNIIFQAPQRAILYQNGVRQGLNEDIREAKNLVALLTEFYGFREPDHEEWEAAVKEFGARIPELADAARKLIEKERRSTRAFRESFEAFYELCRQAINPNLSDKAVEEMLIQHLLTERIFRRVFQAEEFRTRNVIAAEIEKVIASLTSRAFSRDKFLSELDHFYRALERAANDKEDYSEKQAFLNTVYERFFQGYSPKEADTHGIVYTPQPIVDFMVRSVEDILKKEFGRSLADKGVHILDPFVGTGNFIVRVMRQIAETKKSALPYKYEHELHCNEVMLLPYYIASMNIEHEYLEQIGEYKPFEGICLVDTFELAEPEQSKLAFMTEENTARVKRQKEAPIFVIIGNPPYNMGQVNENDENKNRKYPYLEEEIKQTYIARSKATLLNKLSDPYVKAIRWASSRIGKEGVVALVTNSSFVHQIAFDGMRKSLLDEFSAIYVVDLGGNIRTNPELSGTTHNVFGIQVGVSINLFIRTKSGSVPSRLFYHAVPSDWRKENKLSFLQDCKSETGLEWQRLNPDSKGTWLTSGMSGEFDTLLPLANSDARRTSIFNLYSLGVVTNRDAYVYGFNRKLLEQKVDRMVASYRRALASAQQDSSRTVDYLVDVDDPAIKWTRQVKASLAKRKDVKLDSACIREAQFRPFTRKFLYFQDFWNEEQYQTRKMFPRENSENMAIVVSGIGFRAPFSVLASIRVPELHLCASTDGFQGFPFYAFDEDGTNRRENITDWALNEFRTHYSDKKITKWDIFHYVYALLHHPQYRERYAANLKRELPRIPYAPDFHGFAKAGKKLSEWHVNYESQPEYPLTEIENPNEKPSYRVEKMRLGKDKTSLMVNSFLTLSGIPTEVFEYRLGNRSALDWVIDQYQVSTDKRSGITNDPNREDDPQYIVRLVKQVVHVSLETVKIVKALPELGISKTAGAAD